MISSYKKGYFFLMLCVLVFTLPFFIFGKFTIFPVIDNMDCYYVWNKLVAQSKYAFASPATIVQEFMNGLPKFTLLNSYSLFFFLNVLFPSFYAVAINIILIHAVGCFSMYAFAYKYLTNNNTAASVVAALAYGLQPFTYAYGLSIALIPLIVMVFINFYQNKNKGISWLFIVLYPFVSNLQSVGIFIIAIWAAAALFLILKKKSTFIQLLLPLVVLCIIYYANNYPTINNLLFNSYFVSHRKDFKPVVNRSVHIVNTGSITNKPFTFYVLAVIRKIFLVLFVYVLYGMYKKGDKRFKLFLLFLSLAFFYKFFEYGINSSFAVSLQQHSSILKMYHFEKMLFWVSFVNVSAIAICFSYLFVRFNKEWFKYLLITVVFTWSLINTLFWKPIFGLEWKNEGRTFYGFYSPDLFKQIKNSIPQATNTYKVATYGIHPATAQYNGLYTVDGYISNYPLSYKNKFKKIIQSELDSTAMSVKAHQWDFETTGHRCYLLTKEWVEASDLTMPFDKLNPTVNPQTVYWNIDALKNIGCNYIISSVIINTIPPNNKLLLINQFENNYYKLFLYKLV